jgi:DNA modification methylase
MDYQQFLESKAVTNRATGVIAGELPPHLFPFQRDIVRWALARGRAAIFADCGLGKTIMQLEWAARIPGRVLILTPLAVAAQTEREAARFGIEGVSHARRSDTGAKIVVTNYQMVDHFDPSAFAGIVLDESSILKAFDGATRTKLIELFAKTPYRLACTATPAPNDFMELGNHSEFLGVMPRSEMLSMFFVHDGGETQKWRVKGHAQDAFWRWCASWAVMMRKPSDLGYDDDGFDLPPIRFHRHVVRAEHADGFLFPMPASSLQERLAARRDTTDGRCLAAAEIANQHDGQTLVWCNLNAESDALTDAINGAVEVRGSDTDTEKERAMENFSAGSARVLVTKPTIAGFGMNWQHCNKVIFAGLSDSYEQFYQAIRRCWRFGQVNPVDVHIVTADTEGAVVENIKRKEADAARMAERMVAHMSDLNKESLAGAVTRTTDAYQRRTESGDGWTLTIGDCVDVLAEMADESVDFTVYSPPFASLYTYSASERDMGNCADDAAFYEHYRFLVRELIRVTRPGRLLSFHCMNLPTSKVNFGYIGIRDFRGELIRLHEAEGWIYHSEVVIWKDPVTAMQRTKALGLLHKQLKKDSCLSRQGIPDYLVTMRKPGDNLSRVEHTNETFPVSEWQRIASPVWADINPSDTLQFRSAREHKDERHICPLQIEVIRRALRLWSNPGDLVLSPFAGIGSEGYVALQMGRRFVGAELKESYFSQACRNLAAAKVQLELDAG